MLGRDGFGGVIAKKKNVVRGKLRWAKKERRQKEIRQEFKKKLIMPVSRQAENTKGNNR